MAFVTSDSSSNVLYPSPLNYKHPRGNFDYIENSNTREMMVTAFHAIDLLELWNFMKLSVDSYIFSSDSRVILIYNKIEELGYDGHSGGSFGLILRTMQNLARIGEKAFMENWLKLKLERNP